MGEARGYKGETIMADIVIPQQNNYDVAFRSNGESYELVTDLQFWQQAMPVDAFMERVNQRYAINNIIESTGDDGFNVDNVVTAVDGTVTMDLSLEYTLRNEGNSNTGRMGSVLQYKILYMLVD